MTPQPKLYHDETGFSKLTHISWALEQSAKALDKFADEWEAKTGEGFPLSWIDITDDYTEDGLILTGNLDGQTLFYNWVKKVWEIRNF
jgi:hypothetical protein